MHQESVATIQRAPGNNSTHPESRRNQQQPFTAHHQHRPKNFLVPKPFMEQLSRRRVNPPPQTPPPCPCQENYPADAHPSALRSALESANAAWTRSVHLDASGQRHGQQPVSGTADPGVVKQDKSSRCSVDTTKTRSGPQRVRMSSGERPIGAAKGKQSHTEALCQPPPAPPPLQCVPGAQDPMLHTGLWASDRHNRLRHNPTHLHKVVQGRS